jgi:hypothetical protein
VIPSVAGCRRDLEKWLGCKVRSVRTVNVLDAKSIARVIEAAAHVVLILPVLSVMRQVADPGQGMVADQG